MDPRDLSRAIEREHYNMPTREEVMSQFAGATYYSKLYASQEFWQLQLNEKSCHLCTFNTPYKAYQNLYKGCCAQFLQNAIVNEILSNIFLSVTITYR